MDKVKDIAKGKVMVVSDLHGHREDYYKVMERWRSHKEKGEADHLVFLGDLVHARKKWEDASLEIIDDLMRKGCNQPGSPISALMGNHEMVHIYHVELWKGQICYTRPMEDEMGERRAEYISWLMEMPFWARTAGGVLLVHAGASRELGGKLLAEHVVDREYLFNWPHRKLLRELADLANLDANVDLMQSLKRGIGLVFDELPESRFLWELCMNKNERTYGKAYFGYVKNYLLYLSYHAPGKRMQTMVSGHVQVPFGWEVVTEGHLRISTGYGAEDDSFKTYLLIDAEQEYASAQDLEACTRDLY